MKHEYLKEPKVDTTTGEIYFSYPRTRPAKFEGFRKITHWLGKRVENHFDRLIELRVYDDRRIDHGVKK